jgi:uncharacterized membrane protein YedE/YeeE
VLAGFDGLGMKQIIETLSQPWPWYVSGPLIGLTVPLLLLIGNKSFGISSSFSHVCAAVLRPKIPFFRYDWKKEAWNLWFVGGLVLGGIIAATALPFPQDIQVSDSLKAELVSYGVSRYDSLLPPELFSFEGLATLRGFLLIVVGGFLVGFGTRYAGGCTSGHAIMGLSNLQLPSLVATMSFMGGGFIMANAILPFILTL